jgi:hypothetical protein
VHFIETDGKIKTAFCKVATNLQGKIPATGMVCQSASGYQGYGKISRRLSFPFHGKDMYFVAPFPARLCDAEKIALKTAEGEILK